MLRGEKIGLRARQPSDVAVLHAEVYDDVATQVRAAGGPWRPVSPGSDAMPFRVLEPSDDAAVFSVVQLSDGELAGSASLWGIDSHNRHGHIGLSMLPAARGRGLGTDVVRTLCHYGFAVRSLHRLQIETLADNMAMIRAATAAGFVLEGTLRAAAWIMGGFADEVVYGLLAEDWQAA
jgi:RimJ/RimL family protein N-acetyltransferase